MQMIDLNTERENPEGAVRGRGEGTVESGKDPLGPEASDHGPSTKGDVHGMCGCVRRSGTVRDPRAASRGELPSGTGSAAAPRSRYGEGELQAARHLDRATIAR